MCNGYNRSRITDISTLQFKHNVRTSLVMNDRRRIDWWITDCECGITDCKKTTRSLTTWYRCKQKDFMDSSFIHSFIIRSRRQQRSIASTPRDRDWQPCAIPFWCRMESLQCGGATSDVDDRVVYASVSLDGCSLSHRWLAAGLDVPGRYSPALQHCQTTATVIGDTKACCISAPLLCDALSFLSWYITPFCNLL